MLCLMVQTVGARDNGGCGRTVLAGEFTGYGIQDSLAARLCARWLLCRRTDFYALS
jgi:hypothetical protein